jgi:hypothetical protein
MTPSPFLHTAKRERTRSDAHGILPLTLCAHAGIPVELKAHGLFIADNVIAFVPPKADLVSGEFKSQVAQIAANVREAMRVMKLKPIDLIESAQSRDAHYTPLHKIFKEFDTYETNLVNFLLGHKDKLADNAAFAVVEIVRNLNKAHKQSEDTEKATLRKMVNSMLKKSRDDQLTYLKERYLVTGDNEMNEEFTGLSTFDSWYKQYVTGEEAVVVVPAAAGSGGGAGGNADMEGVENTGRRGSVETPATVRNDRADDLESQLRSEAMQGVVGATTPDIETNWKHLHDAKKAREIQAIDAFADAVESFQVYFNRFLSSNGLDTTAAQTVSKTWRDAVFGVEERKLTLLSEFYTQSENKVVGNYVWYILLERFEVFASVVHSAFDAIVGHGDRRTKKASDEFVRMGIMSAMFHLFHRKAMNHTIDQLARLSTDSKDPLESRYNAIIGEFASVHGQFKTWNESFLQGYWIPKLNTLEKKANDVEKLRHRILVALFTMDKIDWWTGFNADTSRVRNLSIDSTVEALEKAVDDQFKLLKTNKSLLTADHGKNSLRNFVQTVEHDKLRDAVFAKMCSGLTHVTAQQVSVVFAAKVLATLNNQNPLYDALYLIQDEANTTRSKLAHSVLQHVKDILFVKSSKETIAELTGDNLTWLKSTPLSDVRTDPKRTLPRTNTIIAHDKITHLLDDDAALWIPKVNIVKAVISKNEQALTKKAQANEKKPPQQRAKTSGGKTPAKKEKEAKKGSSPIKKKGKGAKNPKEKPNKAKA